MTQESHKQLKVSNLDYKLHGTLALKDENMYLKLWTKWDTPVYVGDKIVD